MAELDMQIIDDEPTSEIKITVVGVGGGGGNTINHLSKHGVHKSVRLIAVNTDVQHLNRIESHDKIRLGEKTTRGLGAGMKPEVGRKSAEESYETIKEHLRKSDIVFIATGLGGGTGTGAAPIVARAAKEEGALTIAVVTKPFKREGEKRARVAEQGLREIKDEADTIIVIPNEKLLSTVSKSLGIKESFELVDDVLSQAVNGISSLILSESDVNADYADLMTIMGFKGLALIGIGYKDGDNAAVEAVQEALESPLLDNISIKGAKGAIIHFEYNENYPLTLLDEAIGIIQEQIDPNADYKVAYSSRNSDLAENQVRATLIITGFEKEILNKDSAIPETQAQGTPTKPKVSQVALRKVAGMNESLFDKEEDLEIPTFFRNQRD